MLQIFKTHIAFVAVLLLLLAGCASGPAPVSPTAETATPVMYGRGTSATAGGALNAARADVVRRAADRILGPAPAAAKRGELDGLFNMDLDMNPFLIRESLEIISRTGEAGSFSAQISIRVDLNSLSSFLRSKEIYGGQVLPQGGEVRLANEARPAWIASTRPAVVERPAEEKRETPAPAVKADPVVIESADLSDEELAKIQEFMANLSFVVYFDTKTETDPFLMRAAVSSANSFLGDQGYRFRDFDQVARLREDQDLVYEEETGGSISIIQWIAARLRADIYIEIAASVNSSSEGNRHFGSAAVTLNIFEAATGNGIGQAFYQTNPPAFSTLSQTDALNNAMASAVYMAMPRAIQIARDGFARTLSEGILFEVTFINTGNARIMREFQQRMQRRVKSMDRVSFSANETRYNIRYIGTVEDLEFLIYDMGELVPGLENMTMIMQRGNSLTFETGM